MPVDNSIYNALLQKPKTVAEYDAEALANQTNALGLQMGRQKMDEYQRSVTDANKLRQTVAGFGADQSANYNALLGSGNLKAAQDYQKANADLTKTGAETAHLNGQAQKDKFGVIVQANGLVGSAAGAIMQNPDYNHAVSVIGDLKTKLGPELSQQMGLDTLQVPQEPSELKAWANDHYLGSIDTAKQLEDARVKAEGLANRKNAVDINAATNARVASEGAANRGQAERHFKATQDANPAGQITQTESGPVMVDKRTGIATPITLDGKPVTAAGKPLTEAQGKATLFVSRMDKADKIMTGLNDSGTKNPALLSGVPLVGNFTASDKQQQLEQAQRDFVNATLRQESGAAISPTEFDSAKKQYFPQRGDSQAVIDQKAENRRTAIAGMGIMAGPGMAKIPAAAPKSANVPTKNVKGWALHTDASGNQAYVSPDGKQFQEVK